MKCYVPFVGELSAAARHLLAVAEVMGAECAQLSLPRHSADPIADLSREVKDEAACIAFDPQVLAAWLPSQELPAGLASYLSAHFQAVLLHNLDSSLVSMAALRSCSGEGLVGVQPSDHAASGYQMAAIEMCSGFSGLTFGPARHDDSVLKAGIGSCAVEPIVSIGGESIFARTRRGGAEFFFLAKPGEGRVELDANVAGRKVAEYFADVLPLCMFLRHVFRAACWHPAHRPQATLIVDDPPLWKRYGFLNYERLLSFMDEFRFHTTIAFIPYYFNSSSSATVRLFRQRPDRLSVCFHGNDHTGGELASHDAAALHDSLSTARARMQLLQESTGIPCGNVMVFPQGRFSPPGMQALKEHGFVGAVNSGHSPANEEAPLPLRGLMQPSLLSYQGFPLFLRKYVGEMRGEDVAWNVFFGRPILIVEHQEFFKEPSRLFELATLINKLAPDVNWCNVQTALESACLVRGASNGVVCMRPYAMAARIGNSGSSPQRYVVEFDPRTADSSAGFASLNESPVAVKAGNGAEVRIEVEVPAGESCVVAWNAGTNSVPASAATRGMRKRMRVYVRRRLSEVRDNYLSKSPALMAFVRSARQVISR